MIDADKCYRPGELRRAARPLWCSVAWIPVLMVSVGGTVLLWCAFQVPLDPPTVGAAAVAALHAIGGLANIGYGVKWAAEEILTYPRGKEHEWKESWRGPEYETCMGCSGHRKKEPLDG